MIQRGSGCPGRLRHSPPEGAVEELLYRYRRYLVVERGVGASTVRGYVRVAGQFLDGRVCSDGGLTWSVCGPGM